MNEVHTLTLTELVHFDAELLTPGRPHRLDVAIDSVTVPLLVVPRLGADHLLVLNNGAVDQERAGRQVVFQRSTWHRKINHHQIYVYDPATGAPDYLPLGWGQISPQVWAAFPIGRAVRALAERLGVTDPARRTYFGSSAGGYMALALLGDDAGARAIINNAQFDWTRWMAPGVNALRSARFGNMYPAHIRSTYPVTANVLNFLARRNRPLEIDYHVNVASLHDREVDLPEFNAFVRAHPHLCRRVTVHHYFDDTAGHNPLSQERTLSLIDTLSDRGQRQ